MYKCNAFLESYEFKLLLLLTGFLTTRSLLTTVHPQNKNLLELRFARVLGPHLGTSTSTTSLMIPSSRSSAPLSPSPRRWQPLGGPQRTWLKRLVQRTIHNFASHQKNNVWRSLYATHWPIASSMWRNLAALPNSEWYSEDEVESEG